MIFRKHVRRMLSVAPLLEVAFRRFIWSRIHFPEAEIAFLHSLSGRPIDVAVDVGAALGHYAWTLDRKSRRVIAFEPGRAHADFLARGLWGTRIELVRKAVGREVDIVPMYTPGDDGNALASATLSTSNPVVNETSTHIIDVPVISLDQYLSDVLKPSERLDLLKVDVEGYELEVFEGATARLEKDKPIILAEIEARHNPRFSDVFSLLRRMGYTSYIMQHGQFRIFEGADLSAIQRTEDLILRVGTSYRPGQSNYINNFTFVHPDSKIRIV